MDRRGIADQGLQLCVHTKCAHRRTRLCHFADGLALFSGHETDEREDDDAGKEARTTVDAAHEDCLSTQINEWTSSSYILVHIIVILVVTAQRHQRAQAETVRKEYLRTRVHPHLRLS